ncbi:hypothetical protein KEM52_000654, partial [Ascosphaera acerosa]
MASTTLKAYDTQDFGDLECLPPKQDGIAVEPRQLAARHGELSDAIPEGKPVGFFHEFSYREPQCLLIRHANRMRTDLDVFLMDGHKEDSPVMEDEGLRRILSGQSPCMTWKRRRTWCDAQSGAPLFRVYEKTISKQWDIELLSTDGEPIQVLTSIVPRSYSACWYDRYEMTITGGRDMRERSTIQVEGHKLNKNRLTVHCDGETIMVIRRTDSWAYLLLCKRLAWEVELAAGVDASL